MKKIYNFRIEPTLIKKIDELDGSRAHNVRTALQMYIRKGYPEKYDVNALDLLQNHIKDLQNDKIYLQNRLDAFMTMKTPLLQRVINKIRQEEWKKEP